LQGNETNRADILGLYFGGLCDPHIDPVFLGLSEFQFLGDAGRGDTKAVKAYLDKGENVNLQDEPGITPLHMCNNKEIAEMLIDNGANVNAKTKRSGETPLFSATHGATQGGSKSY